MAWIEADTCRDAGYCGVASSENRRPVAQQARLASVEPLTK
jgi:hypothetical protein